MHRSWLAAACFVVGIALVLVSALGGRLAGLHLLITLRVALLVGGLVLLSASLETMGLFSVRDLAGTHEPQVSRLFNNLLVALTAAGVLAIYLFFATLGTWNEWAPTTSYYDRLASSFAAGRLDIAERPDPALLALPNIYDPEARKDVPGLVHEDPHTIWDMSVYDGRVYLYWGPAPALLLLPVHLIYHAPVGDEQLTFLFLCGAFLFESLLIIHMRRRFFPEQPAWTEIAGMLTAAFVTPVTWALFSGRIYEAAIAAGQFFLMGGLFFALTALDGGRVSRGRLAAAAALWALAAASRATLAVPVAFAGLLVVLELLLAQRPTADASGPTPFIARLASLAAFAVPLLGGAALLAWYNQVRFGSPLEFGFRYAITMLDQNKYHDILFSPRYMLENAYIYFLNLPALDTLFPFVRPLWNEASVRQFNSRIGGIYNSERTVGLLYAAPVLLLGLLAPVLALRTAPRSEQQTIPPAQYAHPAQDSRFLRRFVLGLAGLAVMELGVVLLLYYATMRYLLDAVPTLVLLALLGLWLGLRSVHGRRGPTYLFSLLGLLLVVLTAVAGALIGFSSDVPRIRAANPWLLSHARQLFIILLRRLGI